MMPECAELCYTHFTNGETGAKNIADLPLVTQQAIARKGSLLVLVPSLCLQPLHYTQPLNVHHSS